MIIFKSINKLAKEVNFKANVGFVPTMGSLHKGHKSLIKIAKKKCKKVIVSIFVNPSQFNKIHDYKKYPRNLSRDISVLKKLKVDFVLIPSIKDIFKNTKNMKVNIKPKDKVLCAKFRPGHFEGVLAVINEFLKSIKSKYIFLGEKDFQQLYLIKKFINQKFKTKVFNCKTIRDKNTLPFSSRNNLLNISDIKKASIVSRALKKLYLLIKINLKNKIKILDIKDYLVKQNIKVEYLELRNKINFTKNINKKNFKIFVAFYIKNVRLIDNF